MSSEDSAKDDRNRIDEALAACSLAAEEEDTLEGSVVTRWVVVAERMATDGQRWLTRLSSEHATKWEVRGMLHEVLETEWGDS